MISVIIPGIRPHLWPQVLETLDMSIGKYDGEVIFVGPFEPQFTESPRPFQYIHSFAPVAVCIQLGLLEAKGDLVFQTVDDAIFIPCAISNCIDFYKLSCGPSDIVNMLYSEGENYTGHIQTPEEWRVKAHSEFHLPFINPNWQLSVQPMMSTDYLKSVGGLDCRFRYSNHSHHDLIFRCQQNGSVVHHSPQGVSRASHTPGTTGDHGPIHNAQLSVDAPVFRELWSNPRQSIIDIENYKPYNKTWQDRFSKLYTSYEELCEGEGYKW